MSSRPWRQVVSINSWRQDVRRKSVAYATLKLAGSKQHYDVTSGAWWYTKIYWDYWCVTNR